MSRLDADALTASVTALIGAEAATARFGIAVSGGVDSMALLLLAHQAFPGRIMAASVDHGMRPAAADECRHVATVADGLGVPHRILTLDTAPTSQASARAARYACLLTWQRDNLIDWVMTAHHADDQLETMIMRLNRSSGVGGIAGIRAIRDNIILRPLLSFRRNELEAVVMAAGVIAVDDPSNRDCHYDRARLRIAMTGQTFLNPVAAARSAALLADAETAIDWMVRDLAEQRCYSVPDGFMVTIDGLPDLLTHRLIEHMLWQADERHARGGRLAVQLARLLGGEKITAAGCTLELVGGSPLSVLIRRAPPRSR